MLSLCGKTVLITGASSGLGEHFARLAAKAGANVVIAARRIGRLERLAAELQEIPGTGRIFPVGMDVTNVASIRTAFARAEAEVGVSNVIVNNSGVARPKISVDMEVEDWDDLLNVNLRGAFFVAQEGCRRMINAKVSGSVINISSILGSRQGTSQTNYGTSKAGLNYLTKNMALELIRNNIRMNAIAPGYFQTELNDEFFASDAGKAFLGRIPPRRLGELHELDGLFYLLASDASSFITGQIIQVDGGHSLSAL